jgi:phosphatidylinositol alpha 1,6-mannosyltransferase
LFHPHRRDESWRAEVGNGGLVAGFVGRAIASLDVLVNPGSHETFCQVVQEALCAGVPVIAAASGGPLDLVRHGENGWLWAGDDPEVLAAQVAAVRDDPAELADVRSRARSSVSFRTWSRVTDQLLSHYRTALDEHPAQHVRRSIGA